VLVVRVWRATFRVALGWSVTASIYTKTDRAKISCHNFHFFDPHVLSLLSAHADVKNEPYLVAWCAKRMSTRICTSKTWKLADFFSWTAEKDNPDQHFCQSSQTAGCQVHGGNCGGGADACWVGVRGGCRFKFWGCMLEICGAGTVKISQIPAGAGRL